MTTFRWGPAIAPVICLLAAVSCARPAFVVPSGPGAPAPDASSAWQEATAECAAAASYSAALHVSGRAGGKRLRGTILGGVTRDGHIRLEAPAPFGRPAFVLAGDEARATLVTRDNQVLSAPADAILEALTGIPLDPAGLLTLLSGCGFATSPVEEGTRYTTILAVRTAGGRAFLESVDGRWRVIAAQRDGLLVEYRRESNAGGGWPRRLFLNSEAGVTPAIALVIDQDQVEVNVPFPAGAFDVATPVNATPLALEDLRAAGPLGDAR